MNGELLNNRFDFAISWSVFRVAMILSKWSGARSSWVSMANAVSSINDPIFSFLGRRSLNVSFSSPIVLVKCPASILLGAFCGLDLVSLHVNSFLIDAGFPGERNG